MYFKASIKDTLDTIYSSKILIHAYLRTQTTSQSGCQGAGTGNEKSKRGKNKIEQREGPCTE